MRSGPLYSHRKDDLDEQSRQLKLKKVNCALRFSWLILRMSTSSSAWSSRQLPALRCRCGWVTSSADAMRPASASCLQSQNREAKASVARAEARRAVDGHFCCLPTVFGWERQHWARARHTKGCVRQKVAAEGTRAHHFPLMSSLPPILCIRPEEAASQSSHTLVIYV